MPEFVVGTAGCAEVFVELVAAVRGLVPGGVAHQEDEEDDATGPYVDEVAVVALTGFCGCDVAGYDLRCSVRWTPAASGADLALAAVGEERCQAKVCDLEIAFRGEEDIFWLDVPVTHAFGVHESNGADELREVDVCNVLPYTDIRLYLVEQVSSFGQLHGYPFPRGVFSRLKELNNVRMATKVFV